MFFDLTRLHGLRPCSPRLKSGASTLLRSRAALKSRFVTTCHDAHFVCLVKATGFTRLLTTILSFGWKPPTLVGGCTGASRAVQERQKRTRFSAGLRAKRARRWYSVINVS